MIEEHIIDVTRENFDAIMPLFTRELSRSRFISFDCEFSGLDVDKRHQVNRYDRLEQRYSKIRQSAMQFEVVQFGLCLWFINEDIYSVNEGEIEIGEISTTGNDNGNAGKQMRRKSRAGDEYSCKLYNFYLMKHNHRNEVSFLSQPHCLQFLVSHGMDFNKVFSQGITYMNETEENEFVEALRLKQKMKNQMKGEKVPLEQVSEEERSILDRTRQEIAFWLENNPHGKCLNLPPYTASVRKLMFDHLIDEFPQTQFKMARDKITFESFVRVIRADHFANQSSKQVRELNSAIGFRRVIKMIMDHVKTKSCTILGHNMFLDMAHIMHKFVRPLPDSLEEFRQLVVEHFPHLIDTKYLVTTDEFLSRSIFNRSSTLEHLFDGSRYQLRPSTNELFFCDHEYFFGVMTRRRASHGLHSAGWDAFMTGYSFIQISYHIAQRSNSTGKRESISGVSHLQSFMNVLHMMRSEVNFDLRTPLLKEENESHHQDRSLVFYVSGLNDTTGTEKLDELFGKYGKFKTSWIDQTSTFVELGDLSLVQQCASELCSPASSDNKCLSMGVTVIPYDEADRVGILASQLSQANQHATAVSRKRSRDSSSTIADDDDESSEPPAKKKANTCRIM